MTGKRTPKGDRPLFFYGWVIVFAMASAGAVSMAMGSLNFGLFIKPMGDDLGIGRAYFGWAQTARQVSSSVTSPPVGWLLDRFGSRVMLPVAALITGGAMITLSFIGSAWHLVALFAVMGLVGMSGPGALATSVPVLKWFVRRRGTAIAFVGLGIPIGAMVFVPLTQLFIDTWGWRTAWIALAVLGIGVIVPLSLVLVRRQPEDMGLLPDGLSPLAGPDDTEADASAAPRQDPEVFLDSAGGDADSILLEPGRRLRHGVAGGRYGRGAQDRGLHGQGPRPDTDLLRHCLRCGLRGSGDVRVRDAGQVGLG